MGHSGSIKAITNEPWVATDQYGELNSDGTLLGPAGFSPVLAITGYHGRDGAAFVRQRILRSVNSHSGLLAALQKAHGFMKSRLGEMDADDLKDFEAVCSALALPA